MAQKIYTKTGDAGETSLFGGQRLPKHDTRIEAYGTVDELNASVGYLYELTGLDDAKKVLLGVQNKLFNIGSVLAADPSKSFDLPSVAEGDVEVLEREIDRMDEEIPPLKQFILPGGHPHAAYAHVARTVCRRAERRVVALSVDAHVAPLVIRYLNRLSDYLFTLARYITHVEGGMERKWESKG